MTIPPQDGQDKSIVVIKDGDSCHILASEERCEDLPLQRRHQPQQELHHMVQNAKSGHYEDTVLCHVATMPNGHLLEHHMAPNAKSGPFDEQVASEMSGERVIHLSVSESQKPNMSGKIMSVPKHLALDATKSEMRVVSENPSSALDTNNLPPLSPIVMSLLQKYGEPKSNAWPTGLLTLHGTAHRILLTPDLKSWKGCTPHVKISYMDFDTRTNGNDHTCISYSHHYSPVVACNTLNNCTLTKIQSSKTH